MSQNRQAEKDRLNAEHDYEVNLKDELAIMMLHEKVDSLRERQWSELLASQKKQLRLLGDLQEKQIDADWGSRFALCAQSGLAKHPAPVNVGFC